MTETFYNTSSPYDYVISAIPKTGGGTNYCLQEGKTGHLIAYNIDQATMQATAIANLGSGGSIYMKNLVWIGNVASNIGVTQEVNGVQTYFGFYGKLASTQPIMPYSYMVYKDPDFANNGLYNAKDANGTITWSSTNAGLIFNNTCASLTNGGLIFVKEGVYLTSTQIIIANDGISIVGESSGKWQFGDNAVDPPVVIRAPNTLNTGIIVFNPLESLKDGKITSGVFNLKNIMLDGSAVLDGLVAVTGTTDGLILNCASMSQYENLFIVGCRNGLVLNGVTRSDFSYVYSEFNVLDAMGIHRSVINDAAPYELTFTKVFLLNSRVGLNSDLSSVAGGVGKFTFDDCHFEVNQYQGAKFLDTEYVYLTDCLFEENNQILDANTSALWFGPQTGDSVHGIYMDKTMFVETKAIWGAYISTCTLGSLTDCTIEGTAKSLRLDSNNWIKISNNYLPQSALVGNCTHLTWESNAGFATENTVLNVANTTSTTFVFNHGLISSANSVQCTFDLTVGYTWTWTSTSTQITVTITPNTGVTLPGTYHILSADVKYIP